MALGPLRIRSRPERTQKPGARMKSSLLRKLIGYGFTYAVRATRSDPGIVTLTS